MSWATDGQDGSGLHLEKMRLNFFKFIASILKNSLKLRLWLVPFENSLDTFLLVFYKHFMYDKGTYFFLEAVLTKNPANHHDTARLTQISKKAKPLFLNHMEPPKKMSS